MMKIAEFLTIALIAGGIFLLTCAFSKASSLSSETTVTIIFSSDSESNIRPCPG